jgi:hypothetical protein
MKVCLGDEFPSASLESCELSMTEGLGFHALPCTIRLGLDYGGLVLGIWLRTSQIIVIYK